MVLRTIQKDLLTYSDTHLGDRDKLPKMEIEFGNVDVKIGRLQMSGYTPITTTKGILVTISGVRRVRCFNQAIIFCRGNSLGDLDQIQEALVTLAGDSHQTAIKDIIVRARDLVYAGNPVRRFVQKLQTPGHETPV